LIEADRRKRRRHDQDGNLVRRTELLKDLAEDDYDIINHNRGIKRKRLQKQSDLLKPLSQPIEEAPMVKREQPADQSMESGEEDGEEEGQVAKKSHSKKHKSNKPSRVVQQADILAQEDLMDSIDPY
jgi:hypothetical protein